MFGREIELPIDVSLSQTSPEATVLSHIENILENHEIYSETSNKHRVNTKNIMIEAQNYLHIKLVKEFWYMILLKSLV